MNTSPSSHAVTVCRGATHCPHAVLARDPAAELAAVIETSGWPLFLAERVQPIRHHHRFRVTVAACPNGCSQPHIADFALIAAAVVDVAPDKCTDCGQCVPVCAEQALNLDAGITLDPAVCLGCAACTRVCPAAALTVQKSGYQVLLGGKLGRHPRLAHELGLYDPEQVPDILRRTLAVYMEHHRPGLRLGDVIERLGRDRFDALVRP